MKHKSQENAAFIAIHPTTYRSRGFLAHGVLNPLHFSPLLLHSDNRKHGRGSLAVDESAPSSQALHTVPPSQYETWSEAVDIPSNAVRKAVLFPFPNIAMPESDRDR